MPWEQTSAMNQRVQFIADWLSDDYTKMDLCRAYGISRPTADKWIQRYQQGGVEQLEERSRAAHCHPNQTSEEICQMLIDTKLYWQSWGPKKVLDYLRENGPELFWPADSTAGEILKRVGLVKRRVRHHHVSPYSEPFGDCQGPNQIWSADFKGDFALGNHRRCYPLTLSDNFSRYLLLCRALEHPSYQAVRPWLESRSVRLKCSVVGLMGCATFVRVRGFKSGLSVFAQVISQTSGPVGEGVSEMRIDYGPGYRIYFKKIRRETVILLAGGDKRTQSSDIQTALRLARNL